MTKLRAIFCALFRHSRISTYCFGYQYCGRCGATLGDTLGGVGEPNLVSLKHRKAGNLECNCARITLTWIDWAFLPQRTLEDS